MNITASEMNGLIYSYKLSVAYKKIQEPCWNISHIINYLLGAFNLHPHHIHQGLLGYRVNATFNREFSKCMNMVISQITTLV